VHVKRTNDGVAVGVAVGVRVGTNDGVAVGAIVTVDDAGKGSSGLKINTTELMLDVGNRSRAVESQAHHAYNHRLPVK
jgi:hypothetical protein